MPDAPVGSLTSRKRVRKSFGRISEVAPMPNLIEIQKSSYDHFLQVNVKVEDRDSVGLQEVFKTVFPIKDFAENSMLEFVRYELEEPKFDVEECQQRGLTFAAPLKVTLRLVVWDVDEDTGARSIRDIKEQEVYMGDMPLMTQNGTFVINGTERVIVSQMHRSPGVFFDHDKGKTHSSGKYLFAARVIPYRGSWLDFEFDAKDILYVRIDRRRKLPASTLLMALLGAESEDYIEKCHVTGEDLERTKVNGMTADEILGFFYGTINYSRDGEGWSTPFVSDGHQGQKLTRDLVDAKTRKVVANTGEKMTKRAARKLVDGGLKDVFLENNELLGHFISSDIINEETGEVYFQAGAELTEEMFATLAEEGLEDLSVLAIDHTNIGPYIRNTLMAKFILKRVQN